MYANCFLGNEFVSWLIENQHFATRPEAVLFASQLLMHRVIHEGVYLIDRLLSENLICTVRDKYHFQDQPKCYRFRLDDESAVRDHDSQVTIMQGVRLYHLMRHTTPRLIIDRVWILLCSSILLLNDAQTMKLQSYPSTFVASEFIDWLTVTNFAENREDGLAFAVALHETEFFSIWYRHQLVIGMTDTHH